LKRLANDYTISRFVFHLQYYHLHIENTCEEDFFVVGVEEVVA